MPQTNTPDVTIISPLLSPTYHPPYHPQGKDWDLLTLFVFRKIAMFIREPELAYNTENKRIPRGGRQYSYCSQTACCGCACGNCGPPQPRPRPRPGPSYVHGSLNPGPQQKRAAEKEGDEDLAIEEKSDQSKAYWVDLFNGFAEMTDPVSSDL